MKKITIAICLIILSSCKKEKHEPVYSITGAWTMYQLVTHDTTVSGDDANVYNEDGTGISIYQNQAYDTIPFNWHINDSANAKYLTMNYYDIGANNRKVTLEYRIEKLDEHNLQLLMTSYDGSPYTKKYLFVYKR